VIDKENTSDDEESADDTDIKTEDNHENVSEKSSGCSVLVL